MSDVFYEMSKVTIKPVVNYTVLQIFVISSLNFIYCLSMSISIMSRVDFRK